MRSPGGRTRLFKFVVTTTALVLTSAGAAVAGISQLSAEDRPAAHIAQYSRAVTPVTPPDEGSLGENEVIGDRAAGGSGSSPAESSAPGVAPTSVGSKSLPFTGFLAFPVLFLGAGLLAAGVVGRRRFARPVGEAV